MDRIVRDNITYRGQEEVSAGIAGFYQKLYSAGDTIQDADFGVWGQLVTDGVGLI